MSFGCHILDYHLREESALLIGEDQLVIRNYVDEVGAHIQRRLEEMGLGFEILVSAAVLAI